MDNSPKMDNTSKMDFQGHDYVKFGARRNLEAA